MMAFVTAVMDHIVHDELAAEPHTNDARYHTNRQHLVVNSWPQSTHHALTARNASRQWRKEARA